jgi:hypothetical protein
MNGGGGCDRDSMRYRNRGREPQGKINLSVAFPRTSSYHDASFGVEIS